jgi:kynureninase
MDLPLVVGEKIGRLLGARPGEVVVTDSTSINLFKALAAALELRPDRRIVLSEAGNFPTDLYMFQGLERLLGDRFTLKTVPRGEVVAALRGEIGAQTAVVCLSHVCYKTGGILDLAEVTAAAHEAGAVTVWDLAHSAGVLPLDLPAAGVDLAVGCGYKYLNGGPGAPAYVYAAERLHGNLHQPLSGWLGHAEPFAFSPHYEPAPGIARFVCGTPPILSLAALDEGVDLLLEADLGEIRKKSRRLGDLFLQLVAERCGEWDFEIACPTDSEHRGSQVSLRHPHGYAIVQALIAEGVIGDFRAPDVLRFGFAPLYTSYGDLWTAVETLRRVMASRAWDRPEFRQRNKVT